MSFQMVQLESGLKVTLTLRHLGFWFKDQWSRLLQDLDSCHGKVFLDLGQVSYVDVTIRNLLEEARKQNPRIELVGFPRGIHGISMNQIAPATVTK